MASQHLPEPLELLPASAAKEKALSWLWFGYLPKGKVSIIEGAPDQGKGLITIDLAARVTRGDHAPFGGDVFPAGRVLITPGEDGWEDTIIPRLIAAGADLDRVLKLQHADGSHFLFPRDLARLSEFVEHANLKDPEIPIRLAIVDPFNAHIENYRDPIKLRKHLVALSSFSGHFGINNLIVRHFNKDDDAKEPLNRGSGFIDITGAARTTLQVWGHPKQEGVRALAPEKHNLSERQLTLLYKIEGVPALDRDGSQLCDDRGRPTTVGRIKWVGTSTLTAKQLMRGQQASRKAEAERWLEELLEKHGPMLKQEIEARAEAAGFKSSTLRDASGNIDDLAKDRTPTSPPLGVWYLTRHGKPTADQLKELVEARSEG